MVGRSQSLCYYCELRQSSASVPSDEQLYQYPTSFESNGDGIPQKIYIHGPFGSDSEENFSGIETLLQISGEGGEDAKCHIA